MNKKILNIIDLVFCIFLTLKLCNVLNWSWLWITSPLWIDLLIRIIASIGLIFIKSKEEKRNKYKSRSITGKKLILKIILNDFKILNFL